MSWEQKNFAEVLPFFIPGLYRFQNSLNYSTKTTKPADDEKILPHNREGLHEY